MKSGRVSGLSGRCSQYSGSLSLVHSCPCISRTCRLPCIPSSSASPRMAGWTSTVTFSECPWGFQGRGVGPSPGKLAREGLGSQGQKTDWGGRSAAPGLGMRMAQQEGDAWGFKLEKSRLPGAEGSGFAVYLKSHPNETPPIQGPTAGYSGRFLPLCSAAGQLGLGQGSRSVVASSAPRQPPSPHWSPPNCLHS